MTELDRLTLAHLFARELRAIAEAFPTGTLVRRTRDEVYAHVHLDPTG